MYLRNPQQKEINQIEVDAEAVKGMTHKKTSETTTITKPYFLDEITMPGVAPVRNISYQTFKELVSDVLKPLEALNMFTSKKPNLAERNQDMITIKRLIEKYKTI